MRSIGKRAIAITVIAFCYEKGIAMGLLKWIKDTYMEGYNKAKEEQENSDNQLSDQSEQNKQLIPTLLMEKRLLCSVAAPYRVVTFGDWFTLFKDTEENDDHVPLHLHTFGNDLNLTEEQKEMLKQSLEKDFQVYDRESALEMCKEMNSNWKYIKSVSDEFAENIWEARVRFFRETGIGGSYAMLLVMAGHSLTASVDLGYLTEEEAFIASKDMMYYFPLVFDDWKHFERRFLEGNQNIKINRGVGKNVLQKYLGYLLTKTGSPWQWLSIQELRDLEAKNHFENDEYSYL